ncbi:MAG: flagellar assembly protein FliH [Gammaproteobacteria bacterium]|nr:flagellar assembly protein FliH [Gammaproteobacteria bacterium]
MPEKKPSSELIPAQEGEVFSLWDLPSFDDPTAAEAKEQAQAAEPAEEIEQEVRVEEMVAEDVKPLTLDDVEAVRQDAWNEGFSTGEKDGFHAGQLKAAQEAELVLQGKVQALEQVMQAFFEPIAKQDQQLEETMLEMIMQISQQVIQRELTLDSSQITQVVRESLKLLPMGSAAVRVYVNPQDFEQIKALRERHEESWKIIEDDDLLPGGCRFESVNTQINASIETRIEHIATQILEQQRELKSHPLEPDLQVSLDGAAIVSEAESLSQVQPHSEQPVESQAQAQPLAASNEAESEPEPDLEPEPETPAEQLTATPQLEPATDAADNHAQLSLDESEPAPEQEPEPAGTAEQPDHPSVN